MEIPQLMGIANELGVQVSQDSALEDVIYAIIDKAAENSAAGEDAPKRKRTRIAKKDTNKVYTVKGSDGENLDSKSNRTTKKTEPASLFSDMPVAAPEEAAEKKKKKQRSRLKRLYLKNSRSWTCPRHRHLKLMVLRNLV